MRGPSKLVNDVFVREGWSVATLDWLVVMKVLVREVANECESLARNRSVVAAVVSGGAAGAGGVDTSPGFVLLDGCVREAVKKVSAESPEMGSKGEAITGSIVGEPEVERTVGDLVLSLMRIIQKESLHRSAEDPTRKLTGDEKQAWVSAMAKNLVRIKRLNEAEEAALLVTVDPLIRVMADVKKNGIDGLAKALHGELEGAVGEDVAGACGSCFAFLSRR